MWICRAIVAVHGSVHMQSTRRSAIRDLRVACCAMGDVVPLITMPSHPPIPSRSVSSITCLRHLEVKSCGSPIGDPHTFGCNSSRGNGTRGRDQFPTSREW
jgi:hypothetical protein